MTKVCLVHAPGPSPWYPLYGLWLLAADLGAHFQVSVHDLNACL